ncbi:MAG TPA: sodium:solute symporter family protein [Gemmatimonadota bacterium]|nr:sodium:solute symporter family protein [Gemmatimonadota bacterium]
MNATLLAILAYVLAQLGIGWWVSRRIKTEDDYLVAGRNLGYGLAVFTIFATWFGAETCIGAAGRIYESGLAGGSADPFGYALCLFLMGLVFAVPLWKRRLTTMADLFRQRFSPAVERLAVLLMVPTSLLWAAAQIRAFGQVISASSGLEVDLTVTVAALVVIVYTVSGGLLADAITDLVQGVALILGLGVMFVVVLVEGGAEAVARIEPARLNILGGESVPWYEVAEAWAIPVFGSVVAAELVARVLASRTPTIARNSFVMAGGGYLAIGMIPVMLGLIGAQLIPGLEDPEQILPRLAQIHLPEVLYVLFAGALLSAILSTVDSTLLVSSSLVSHNIIVPLRPGLSEAWKVRSARIGVAAFGVLAYGMALYAEGVYALVEQASAFGSAGIVVVVTFGLFTRFGGPASALASLLAGVGIWIVGSYVLELSWAYLAALGGALGTYVLSAVVEGRTFPEPGPVPVE